jgi:hypothetical protein
MAATVWGDAVREIAAYRLRHDLPVEVDGIGSPAFDAPEHADWSQIAAHLARSRTWLATHDNEAVVPPSRTRSTPELHRRRAQLEAIFATAPADHRRLIDTLAMGQLSLDDMSQALDQALAGQDERRRWILEHWPHIVEHAEITRTLTTSTAGPDLGSLLDQLALLHVSGPNPSDPAALLADAARNNEAWLRVLLSHLVPTQAGGIDDAAIIVLARTANYRHRWHVPPTPLGVAATDDDQAREAAELRQVISATAGEATQGIQPPQLAEVEDRARVAELGL